MDEDPLNKTFSIHKMRWISFFALIVPFFAIISYRLPDTSQPATETQVIYKSKIPPYPDSWRMESTRENRLLFINVEQTEALYNSIILQASSRHKIDSALVKAVIMAESRYNPRAVSKKGAGGLMQLMPKTAKELGVVDVFDPEHNIDAGVKYLKQLLKEFDGDVKMALAAYNAGSRKVKKYKGIPPFNATRIYIEKVFKYYQYYKDRIPKETGSA